MNVDLVQVIMAVLRTRTPIYLIIPASIFLDKPISQDIEIIFACLLLSPLALKVSGKNRILLGLDIVVLTRFSGILSTMA